MSDNLAGGKVNPSYEYYGSGPYKLKAYGRLHLPSQCNTNMHIWPQAIYNHQCFEARKRTNIESKSKTELKLSPTHEALVFKLLHTLTKLKN
jgi:hypothetical protein